MTPPRKPAWIPLALATLSGAVVASALAWRLHVATVEREIAEKRDALKRLVLSGGVAPTEGVMAYLEQRGAALELQHARWVELVGAPVPEDAVKTDPQLYFQEQVHDVQRTLERLAAARGLRAPELLGFPKELPPTDTVPRLLVQLSLIEDATELIFGQGVTALTSCKVEDPQPITEAAASRPMLLRLPVRMRLTATLPVLLRLLSALQHARPIMSVSMLRMTAGGPTEELDVELVVSRHLALAGALEPAVELEESLGGGASPAIGGRPEARTATR